MKIFAVDTSSNVATVAITEDDSILGEYSIHHQKTHSQKLMPMIQDLLGNLSLKPEDMDVFTASIGPGSFTGLRIGVTTIKAMAFAASKPAVGVPTLEALAFNLPLHSSLICPIMDARNNQVYTALYAWEQGVIVPKSEPMGILVDELMALLKRENRETIFLGDGVAAFQGKLKDELGSLCEFAPGRFLMQNAASVAAAAFERVKRGAVGSSFDLLPDYLRKSQAEREFEKKGLQQ